MLINRRIKEYEALSDRITRTMKLYRDIFGAQKKYLGRLEVSSPELDEVQIRARLGEGLPLLDPESIEVGYETFNQLFQEIKGIVARKSSSTGTREREFLKNRELSPEEVEELGRAWLEGREDSLKAMAEEFDVDYSVLSLLLHATFAAVFRKLALELHPRIDLDQFPHAACPVCGAPPVMGFNRDEDGLRVLECSLCGSRWGTPRMLCLFCGAAQQEKLKYLFAGEDRARRVYVCDSCKRYIKITDRKGQPEEIVLPLEDLFTSYLDEAAQKEGYDRACRTVFS